MTSGDVIYDICGSQRDGYNKTYTSFIFRGNTRIKPIVWAIHYTYIQWIILVMMQLWAWNENKTFNLRWQPFYAVQLNGHKKEVVLICIKLQTTYTFLACVFIQFWECSWTYLHWKECEIHRRLKSSGQILSRDNRSRRQGTRSWAAGLLHVGSRTKLTPRSWEWSFVRNLDRKGRVLT